MFRLTRDEQVRASSRIERNVGTAWLDRQQAIAASDHQHAPFMGTDLCDMKGCSWSTVETLRKLTRNARKGR